MFISAPEIFLHSLLLEDFDKLNPAEWKDGRLEGWKDGRIASPIFHPSMPSVNPSASLRAGSIFPGN
jgi:hypothetical protein